MSFFQELKRRNVFRMGIAYVVVAWVALQAIDFALEVIDAPGWILQVFVLTAAIGLPIVLIFAWVFEMTPDGIKRESEIDRTHSITPQTGRKIDRVIIGALALAVVLLLVDRFVSSPAEHAASPAVVDSSAATPVSQSAAAEVAPEKLPAQGSIAVLPFTAMSNGADDEYFADGLTEEILNSLAQLPELLVTARTSAFAFKGQDLSIQEIASQLGVRNVVEGSVRRSGDRLRVTAQLIRAADGFHLWSENYDSTAEDTIAVQEDIAEKIAQAMNVVLDEKKREAMRRAGLRDVEAFIALQKGIELYEAAHGAEDQIAKLGEANRYFEVVQQRVPDYSTAYLLHSDKYIHILMDHATGQDIEDFTEEEAAAAMQQAEQDTTAGVAKANSEDARYNAELDQAYLTSNWQGMTSRIERFIVQDSCEETTWVPNIALLTGYAERLIERDEQYLECDPLAPSSWRNLVRTMLWAGNAAGALEVAREAQSKAPGNWLNLQVLYSYVALGDFAGAEQFAAQSLLNDFEKQLSRILIAAARGDREASQRLFAEYQNEPDTSLYWNIIFGAWVGEMELVDQSAARVDQHQFGSPALSTIAVWCNCGAPWDMAVTPKFAADIAESGLSWPPRSVIRFPLKDQVAEVRVTSGGK
jgi:adenylate cyclase